MKYIHTQCTIKYDKNQNETHIHGNSHGCSHIKEMTTSLTITHGLFQGQQHM